MNLDIQTERVAMRPEWHHLIDTWVGRCVRYHPHVGSIEFTLRHMPRGGQAREEVEAVLTVNDRSVRAASRAGVMIVALHDTCAALERELLVHDAVRHAAVVARAA